MHLEGGQFSLEKSIIAGNGKDKGKYYNLGRMQY